MFLKGIAENWAYIGCWTDDGNRDLQDGPMQDGYNADSCVVACSAYIYFALQNNGWCVCGDAYGTEPQYVQTEDSECNPYGERLGGPWRNAVYSNSNPPGEKEEHLCFGFFF